MADINPKRIMQTDISQDVTPDGNPVQQSAAPTSTHRPAPQATKEVSIADLPVVDDNTPATVPDDSPAPVETPKPTEDKPSVDFTDFLKASADVKFVPEKEVKPDAKTETPKAEDDEPIAVSPVTNKQQTTQQPVIQARDLSDLPEPIAPLFKKMSNEAFNTLKPIIKEHAELKKKTAELEAEVEKRKKGGIPDSYYEHPQAFVLTPEFATTSQRVDLASKIVKHWQDQFSKVREGAAEFDNLGQDANGNIVINGKIKADASAEATILSFINATQQQLFKEQGKLEALSMTHRDRHQQAIQWLQNHEKQVFGIFDTPEGQQYLPQINEIIKGFPPALQTNPLARALAKSEAVNYQLAQMLKAASGQGNGGVTGQAPVGDQRQQRLQAVRRSAGPTSGDTGGSNASAGNGKEEVTFDAFERAKQSY